METKMVTLKAEEITSDIAKDGRAVFYGILFDFDKADIKPESEPQLVEMAKALKAVIDLIRARRAKAKQLATAGTVPGSAQSLPGSPAS